MIFRSREASLGPLVLDCVISEEHQLEVAVTDNPVEGGRLDGGTKRTLPRQVTIQAAITAEDMRLYRAAPFAAGTRHIDTWNRLKELWTSTTPFDVITDVDTYRSCTGVGQVSWPREAGSAAVLLFTATFREIASGDVQREPVVDAAAEEAVTRGTDLGRQGLEVVE